MVTCASNDYNNNYKIIQLIRGENDEGICSFGAGVPSYCDSFEDEIVNQYIIDHVNIVA